MATEIKFSVLYRTGGTENAEWHRTFETFESADDAIEFAHSINRQGYLTVTVPSDYVDFCLDLANNKGAKQA